MTRTQWILFGLAQIFIVGLTFLSSSSRSPSMPSPKKTALGTIRTVVQEAAKNHLQTHTGAQRAFQTTTHIPLSARSIFEVVLDDGSDPLRVVVYPPADNTFRVGQRVEVTYEDGRLFYFIKRRYAHSMKVVSPS